MKRMTDFSFEQGPKFTRVPNLGFTEIGGVYGVCEGNIGMLLVAGTVDANGHFHVIASAGASGETAWSVRTFLHAVEVACERLFGQVMLIQTG